MALQIRRGTNAERLTITPLQGELIFTTDTKNVYIGDGTTLGGIPVTSTDINTEDVQDIVAPMFTGGTHTGISFSYNDGSGTINATVTGGGGGGSGTVTSVSLNNANGFSGSVTNPTTTPSITLSTSVSGVLKGNGTAISAAVAGTDYQAPLSAGVDYQQPISLTTTGSSGPATLVGNVLNIPEYAGGGGGGASTLNDLTDVTITGTPSNGQILSYNSGTSQWVNSAAPTSGITQVQEDLTPSLGGNLNISTFEIGGSGRINLVRETGTDTPGLAVTVINNGAARPSHISLSKARGTLASRAAVQNLDQLGSVRFFGWDGSNYINSSNIDALVDGTVSTGIVPTRITFSTEDSTGNIGVRIAIAANGNLICNQGVGLYLGGAAATPAHSLRLQRYRGSDPSTPSAVQNGDTISVINSTAYDGTSFNSVAGSIITDAVGVVSTGVVPGRMSFATASATGVLNVGMFIDSSHVVNVNERLVVTGQIVSTTESLDSNQLLMTHSSNDASNTANITLRRSKGTLNTKTAVINGDWLYDINFQGYDGTDFFTGASIQARVTAAPTAGVIPTQLLFSTRTVAGTITTKMSINQSNIFFGVMPRMPTFANQAAAELSVTSVGGTIFDGLMYYDTALGKIRGRAGGVWVDLH